MTLYEFILKHQDIDELTVWDKDYDMEIYFYPDCVNPADEWDKAMCEIAKKLTIVTENWGKGVTVNLSDVIERNLNNGAFENLFIWNDVDSIMADIENVFAGYVSEKWMIDFATSLK